MNGSIVPLIAGIVYICVGWLPFLGLKVLRPQEALVLTLFGNYAGTLREAGFYFVNPFCIGVNPAAKTKLNQSGDVDGGASKAVQLLSTGVNPMTVAEDTGKKVSALVNK